MTHFLSKNSDPITMRPVCIDSDTSFLHRLYTESREDLQCLDTNDSVIKQLINTQYHAQLFSYHTQFPQADYWLIEYESSPCGRLIISQSGTAWRVVDILILKAKQNQGIGTAIFKRLQQWVGAKQHRIRLQMNPHNSALQHFYQRLGFQVEASTALYQALLWSPDGAK